MSPTVRRLLIVSVALGAVGAGVALSTRFGSDSTARPTGRPSPTTLPSGAGCLPVPAKAVPAPAWFPKDLPLPPGSYVIETPPSTGSTQRIIFAARGSLRDFVTFVLGAWKKTGWILGRGEAEPGEAEDQFAKPREGRYGAFRARSIFCDQSRTWVLIVLGKRTVSASPGATAT